MQLRRLSVTNIRSYETARLDVAPGTTLLVGDVGAGKTSLLYAIEMALFGSAEVDAAYLVRHGAGHAEVTVEFEDADHRYAISRRFRRLRRKGKETYEAERFGFTIDGSETAYSATELRQRVIELLGFPDNPNPQAHSDLWRWAVYVPQERMREILGARPQDRLETVRKALGVERYRVAGENALELATDLRRSAAARRAEADRLRYFDEEYARSVEEGDRLRSDRARLVEAIRGRVADEDSARANLRAAEERVAALGADRRELASLEREDAHDARTADERGRLRVERDAQLVRRREEAAEAAEVGRTLPARRTALADLDRTLAEQRSELERLGGRLRELAEARADQSSAARRLDEGRDALERARQEHDGTERQLADALRDGPTREPPAPTPKTLAEIEEELAAARRRESEAAAAESRADLAVRDLDELVTAGVCPRCHQSVRPQEFADHRAEAVRDAEGARAAGRNAEVARSRLEEVRASRERYERAHERWTEVEKRRSGLRAAVAGADAMVVRCERSVAGAATAVAAAEVRLTALVSAETDEAVRRTELVESERRRTALGAEVERASLAAERARVAEESAASLVTDLGRIDLELDAIRSRRTGRAERIDELRRGLATSAAREADRAAADERLRTAETARREEERGLERTDTRLSEAVRRAAESERGRAERARLVTEADATERTAAWMGRAFREAVLRMEARILAHAQAAFEREFARYFATLLEDPAVEARTDVTFTPAVTIDGEWTPAEALSGGERTSLALAFRLALSHVVRSMGDLRLDTLLLDEPTDGFSPEQVIRMGELLEEIALPQLVIVSHEAQLAAIADRVVRVEKHGGRSRLRAGAAGPDAA
jgi:DNA repair protein SbcC/Rad50